MPDGAKESDHPLAKFADGTTLPIKTITVKDIKAIEAAARLRSKSAVVWDGVRGDDKLSIKKPDRTPLLILFAHQNGEKAEKQLCQVALKVFGDVDAEDRLLHTHKVVGDHGSVLSLCPGFRAGVGSGKPSLRTALRRPARPFV